MDSETATTTDEKAAAAAAAQAEKDRKAAEKAAEKEAKRVEAEAKKQAKAAESEAARAAKAATAEAEKAAKAAAKQAEIDAKAKAKADAIAAREASKMPEQNGVRRPKPDTLCGKAWAIFDTISNKNGAPASIGESLESAKEQSLNEANVRAEYARWRKFHGITGRIDAPKPAETTTAA